MTHDINAHGVFHYWHLPIASNHGIRCSELRRVFAHIRQLVETRYVTTDEEKQESKDLPWQSVSSFLFLRFMVPAILHPHLFGIWPGNYSSGIVPCHHSQCHSQA